MGVIKRRVVGGLFGMGTKAGAGQRDIVGDCSMLVLKKMGLVLILLIPKESLLREERRARRIH
jgi:hypothetical protein